MHIAKFVKGEEFWCSHCDTHKVKSDDPSTGVFLSQFGHEWNAHKKHTSDEYRQIIFAYCSDCIVECGLQPMIDASIRIEKETNAIFNAHEHGLDGG